MLAKVTRRPSFASRLMRALFGPKQDAKTISPRAADIPEYLRRDVGLDDTNGKSRGRAQDPPLRDPFRLL